MLYSVVVTAAEVARFCKEMFLEKYFVKNSLNAELQLLRHVNSSYQQKIPFQFELFKSK